MSWRIVVISKRAKLDLQLGQMVVRGEEVTKIVLSEISTILIESTAVSLTASLIAELAKRKIKVIFCDEKKNPSCELVNYYGSHDTSNKVRKQINWKKNTKEAVWTEIVSEKIRKQKELLELLGKEESDLLESYLKEIAWNDGTNREGHAAKVYFNALFGLEFTRTEDNLINAALNYGYSIILSAFTREIVANGYITQLGVFHDNMFNQFNLASDLMEPFRILVDRQVLTMKLEQFEHEEKMQLVNVLNQEVQIDGKIQYVNNAIKIYCKSIFDALSGDDSSLIRFYRIEPVIEEKFDPDRTILTLEFKKKSGDKKATKKSDDKKATKKSDGKKVTKKTQAQYDKILDFMEFDKEYSLQEFCELLDLKETRTKAILKQLNEYIEPIGSTKNRKYLRKK